MNQWPFLLVPITFDLWAFRGKTDHREDRSQEKTLGKPTSREPVLALRKKKSQREETKAQLQRLWIKDVEKCVISDLQSLLRGWRRVITPISTGCSRYQITHTKCSECSLTYGKYVNLWLKYIFLMLEIYPGVLDLGILQIFRHTI
jgi:hypothetical protein